MRHLIQRLNRRSLIGQRRRHKVSLYRTGRAWASAWLVEEEGLPWKVAPPNEIKESELYPPPSIQINRPHYKHQTNHPSKHLQNTTDLYKHTHNLSVHSTGIKDIMNTAQPEATSSMMSRLFLILAIIFFGVSQTACSEKCTTGLSLIHI